MNTAADTNENEETPEETVNSDQPEDTDDTNINFQDDDLDNALANIELTQRRNREQEPGNEASRLTINPYVRINQTVTPTNVITTESNINANNVSTNTATLPILTQNTPHPTETFNETITETITENIDDEIEEEINISDMARGDGNIINTPNRVRFGNTTINLLQNDLFNNENNNEPSVPYSKITKNIKNKKNQSYNKNGLPTDVATLPEALHKPLQYLYDTNIEYTTIIQRKEY
jgi:hypothetical protein